MISEVFEQAQFFDIFYYKKIIYHNCYKKLIYNGFFIRKINSVINVTWRAERQKILQTHQIVYVSSTIPLKSIFNV